ncbi:MAG TPA: M20/M25/M40 family metallo-hydrolase [Thermoplasmatales archaeon]|nr:M20/M25/M40 family metallo-hydrolase [Thermoplasmatales archaeon]
MIDKYKVSFLKNNRIINCEIMATKMKNVKWLKILVVVTILVVVSILLYYYLKEDHNGNGEVVGLDYQYMLNATDYLGNIVHDAYKGNDIRKGRAFGTKGGNAAANYIEEKLLEMGFKAKNIDKIRLGPIWWKPRWKYSNKVETIDYQLIINYPGGVIKLPKNETFVFPSVAPPLNHNYTFDGVRVVSINDLPPLRELSETYYNISCKPIDTGYIIIGNVSYIPGNASIPLKQEGIVFLVDEEEGCERIINNITNATGIILIHSVYYANTSNAGSSVVRVNQNESNLTIILNLLKNGTILMVNNAFHNETLTFELLDKKIVLPNYPYMILVGLNNSTNPWTTVGWDIYLRSALAWFFNIFRNQTCRGFILYDYHNDTHFMGFTTRDWKGYSLSLNILPPRVRERLPRISRTTPMLPVFSVNGTIGRLLEKYYKNETCNITGSYINQRYVQENWWTRTPGVEAYNVVGKINSKKKSNKIVIISNRYDGWWGETPGDSGAGGAIVLAIAKYFKDNNIKPKRNIVFLFTTGEEYGMRGAWHYYHSHRRDNIIRWIGADQLGFNQVNTTLTLYVRDKTTRKIVWAIVNDTNYTARNHNLYNIDVDDTYNGGGSEDTVWRLKCDTICFVKDYKDYGWEWYHRAGKDFSEGDTLKNMDKNDLNITLELFWNITKYFTVNPDCIFGNISYDAIDSPDDQDTLPDSIRANFSINTTLHQDKVMINVTLYQYFNNTKFPLYYRWINYTVDYPGKDESLTISIPNDVPEGNFSIELKLYNSTGRINEIAGIGLNNYSDTDASDIYHLYGKFE